ncbi:MAG TPA: cytochrome P450 [Ktedonobacteraceae bacterium]|nr:cytochrome P450 [Ktedonobacteraceae bacterium]
MQKRTGVSYDPLHPQPWYHFMCETSPVVSMGTNQAWQVFRFQDVQQILLDPKTFSSHTDLGRGLQASLVTSDPPHHRKLRDLVTQQFTPRTIGQLEGRITAIVHQLLDAVIAAGHMDVVDDLAHPLPTIVIAELLGVPARDSKQFRVWSDAILKRYLSPERERQIQMEMATYFRQAIEQRRRQPENDLISLLLAAEVDGEQLSEQDILSFCVLLLVAGNETTTNLIGNAMLCFDTFPDTWHELREDPSLLPGAIEEVLRYHSPIMTVGRRATSDTSLRGQEIKAGQQIQPMVAAANCDEDAFPQALTFDIRRNPNRHIAFGYGIHFCLGAPLARLEAKITFTALLERLTDIQRIQDIPLEPIRDAGTQGIKHFPITFKSGAMGGTAFHQ